MSVEHKVKTRERERERESDCLEYQFVNYTVPVTLRNTGNDQGSGLESAGFARHSSQPGKNNEPSSVPRQSSSRLERLRQ